MYKKLYFGIAVGGIGLLMLVGAIGSGYFYFSKQNNPNNISPISERLKERCFESVDFLRYKTEKNSQGEKAIISSEDNKNFVSLEVFDLLSATHYHPLEIHKCGVYVMRKLKQPAYAVELWLQDYMGSGKKLIDFASGSIVRYQYDFRVSLNEEHLSLIRGYGGREDYALVIKDLNTLADIFTLSMSEVKKRNPDLAFDFSFTGGGWSSDSRYFWADTHLGANTFGFIRMDLQTKTFDLFPAPPDVLGGDALNLDNGYVTVHPGNVWFGFADEEEAEIAHRKTKGIGTELYVQNLITGTKLFVASTTEPLHYFQPQWLSSTTLQYATPAGTTSTYVIPR